VAFCETDLVPSSARPITDPRHEIAPVGAGDLVDLLPLVRAYCDFYEEHPTDAALLELSQALIADSQREGIQLIARDESGVATGFATVFWSWDTTEASRIGIMNDLFVAPAARGSGLAERLIEGCVQLCQQRGASRLEWETAPQNLRAQAVYDRVGGVREPWLVFVKEV
jgi:GNAT superfamily N-acetyltransferase